MRKFDQRRLEIIDCAAHLFASQGYDANRDRGTERRPRSRTAARSTTTSAPKRICSRRSTTVPTPPCWSLVKRCATSTSRVRSGCACSRRSSSRSSTDFSTTRRVVMNESKRLTGPRWDSYVSSQRRFREIVDRILLDGKEDGSLHFDNLFITSMAFLNLHIATLRWLDPAGPLSPGQISSEFCGVLFGSHPHRRESRSRACPRAFSESERARWRYRPAGAFPRQVRQRRDDRAP